MEYVPLSCIYKAIQGILREPRRDYNIKSHTEYIPLVLIIHSIGFKLSVSSDITTLFNHYSLSTAENNIIYNTLYIYIIMDEIVKLWYRLIKYVTMN